MQIRSSSPEMKSHWKAAKDLAKSMQTGEVWAVCGEGNIALTAGSLLAQTCCNANLINMLNCSEISRIAHWIGSLFSLLIVFLHSEREGDEWVQ